MRKFFNILALFLLAQSFLSASDTLITPHNHFKYMSIGAGPLPFPCPHLGFGLRHYKSHHGLDISMHESSYFVLSQLQSNVAYHYRFNPSDACQFYLG